MLLQGTLVASQKINLVSEPVTLKRNGLPAVIGQKTIRLGQLLQAQGFLSHLFGGFLEIGQCGRRLTVGTGEQERVQLDLGSGDGYDFYYVFVLGISFDRRTAANAIMVTDGLAKQIAVQQRGDQFGVRQSQSPPYTPISYIRM
jgi:hypothetical protein